MSWSLRIRPRWLLQVTLGLHSHIWYVHRGLSSHLRVHFTGLSVRWLSLLLLGPTIRIRWWR